MAEQEQDPQVSKEEEEEDDEDHPDYKPPAVKSVTEILSQDAEDESLIKYKQALLGGGDAGSCVVEEANPLRVIVKKLSLLVEARDEVFLDLTMPSDEIKKQSFAIKEGCQYKIKFYFFVQREIVTGLKYNHKVYRKGISVDKMSCMMGSYGPKMELQSYTTGVEDAPKGMLARGDYTIKSTIMDDDKTIYNQWEWHLAVKKDWC